MDYTPEQFAAIETHDRNVIVIAGAGSGKTRVLVDRFIRLLEVHPEWPVESLAAITFTEKAARELRDRLRSAIQGKIEQAETAEARRFWQRRGSSLDGARIGTIHSLCALIIRANAAILGIDPGFAVLDDTASILAREAALDIALDQLTTMPAATLFVHYRIEDIRSALHDLLQSGIGDLDADAAAMKAANLYSDVVNAALTSLRTDLKYQAAIRWTPDQAPDPADKLTPIWNKVQTLRADLSAVDNLRLLAALQVCAKVIKTNVGSGKNWHGQADEAKARLGIIRDKARAVEAQIGVSSPDIETLSDELLPHWYTAAKLVRNAYSKRKQVLGALDFNDLESYACELLKHDSVRARYRGVEFNHVLVDEFQDTNPAQREIVYALSGLDRPGSLFVVGDPKQAIYGFRGADVRVFEQVQREIEQSGGEKINLDTSFRAHSGLIDGLNDLFGRLDAGVAYSNLKSVRAIEVQHSPTVEIIGFDSKRAPALKGENNRVAIDSLRSWEAELLAERLNALKASQQLIWDRGPQRYRPFEFGDCAVLFPKRAGMAAVENAFKAATIPYVTVAGVGYYNRSEVQDLLSLLQALSNTADELALATMLRSPLYGVSDDGLYGLRLWHPHQTLWAALLGQTAPDQPDAEAIRFAASSLQALRGWVGRVTIAELISRALDATGFLATLTGLPDGPRRVGNINKLLDMAREAGRVSLGDFLTLLKERFDRELREGEAPIDTGGVVQLMTIHASKGLEFPIVALFGADATASDRSSIIRHDPEIGLAIKTPKDKDTDTDPKSESSWGKPVIYHLLQRRAAIREQFERIRLLYVALTRAADKLIVLGKYAATEAKNDSNAATKAPNWMEILGEHFALPRDPDNVKTLIDLPWGTIAYYAPFMDGQNLSTAEGGRLVQPAPVYFDDSEAIATYMPPLLAPIPQPSEGTIRTLTATMIAKLSEAHPVRPKIDSDPPIDRFARVRRQILHDRPPNIPQGVTTISGAPGEVDEHGRTRRFNRAVGEMVHQALQFGLALRDSNALERLEHYAWQAGLTDAGDTKHAVEAALTLLRQSEHSDAMLPLSSIRPDRIRRELPFSLQLGERIINGKIDLLYLGTDGLWTVLDYKTDDVRSESIPFHARRYWGQVGVYALAVEAITGQIPRVQLYYIQAARTITVRESDWRAAIDRFDADLLAALG